MRVASASLTLGEYGVAACAATKHVSLTLRSRVALASPRLLDSESATADNPCDRDIVRPKSITKH